MRAAVEDSVSPPLLAKFEREVIGKILQKEDSCVSADEEEGVEEGRRCRRHSRRECPLKRRLASIRKFLSRIWLCNLTCILFSQFSRNNIFHGCFARMHGVLKNNQRYYILGMAQRILEPI